MIGDEPTRAADAVRPEWRLTPALTAAVVVAVLFAAAGLLAARVDLALLALPFLGAAAWAWDRRPTADEPASSTLASSTVASSTVASSTVASSTVALDGQADGPEIGYTIALATPDAAESVWFRIAALSGEVQEVTVSAHGARQLRGRIPLLHSGPQEIVRVEYRLIGVDGSYLSRGIGPLSVQSVVPVRHAAVSNLPLPHRLQGLTGSHDSARPGDGGDFRDIHPFAPGDRLRRIDWKTTARRGLFAGDLYVRRTAATADATIVVVLDSRDDIGEQVAEWSRNVAAEKGLSSLDVAREAAGSIAAGYLKTGDRIGFYDLASQNRTILPGAGTRHLQRVLRAIELTQPSDAPTLRHRPPVVPSGSLVYVLSTFLDDESARMAALWRGSGHRVIAVDVLPESRFARATRDERIAHRIVMMERHDRIRSLEAQGVELLRWQEDNTSAPREARLRSLSRPQRGGRR
jgi:uncharacterized protein (DUF58 family)